MSVAGDIRKIRSAFRKLDPALQSVVLDLVRDDINRERTAKARAGKGEGKRKGGRRKKEQPAPEMVAIS